MCIALLNQPRLAFAETDIFTMTFEEAELLKLYHNGFNAAKISFFNQAGRLTSAVAAALGKPVSMHAIQQALPLSCEGLWNHRYGIVSGRPFGGGCLPKDAQALAFLESALMLSDASEIGQQPQLFKNVIEVNHLVGRSAKPVKNGVPLRPLPMPVNLEVLSQTASRSRKGKSCPNILESCAGLDLLAED